MKILKIGRTLANEIIVTDITVSGQHACITIPFHFHWERILSGNSTSSKLNKNDNH
jgi:hypothetical protein